MTGRDEAIYLGSYLAPFAPFLTGETITDIYVNRPGELLVEALGGEQTRHEVPELTAVHLSRFARQVAAWNAQGINRRHPLLSGVLPDGSRVQVVLPPATRGEIAIAIRRHLTADQRLEDYADAFDTDPPALPRPASELPADLDPRLALLRAGVRDRKNILICGGASTGKTTFLNALLREVPENERLILIEDAAELRIVHRNAVGLLAVRGSQGEAEVTAEDLLIASLRMRPDRIILGEMRGIEALTYLRAINTGHPGSLSTIHADSPERAVDQLALLLLQAGSNLTWDAVVRYIRASIDFIVHLARVNGRRVVSDIMQLK